MSEFFDYSPHNGMRYDTEEDHEGITIHATQDVGPILDHLKNKRAQGDQGIKRNLWHYCSIPTEVEIELRNKGINIYNKNHTARVLREINQNYPKLKATRLHHEIKG